MSQRSFTTGALYAFGAALVLFAGGQLRADDAADTQEQLRQLRQQNEALQEQLRRQQTLIESLAGKVNAVQEATARRSDELQSLRSEMQEASMPAVKASSPLSFGKVSISGEGGVGFFNTGSKGQFPNAEFRVDEARLFVEAPVFEHVYLFSELNLATREGSDVQVKLGELYVDFENVLRLKNYERLLNVRAGRLYTPFGEEYLHRYAIDNPLISHSLADLWSVDEGLEIYGGAGKFSYALATQNGGISDTQDFDGDKSVAGRVGFEPTRRLHLSASAMRTGNLDVQGDFLSAMWFGNGFFRSLGGPSTTKFHADLLEGDVQFRLPHGSLNGFGGWIHYGDNDPAANNRRDVYYYSLEAIHDLVGKFYGGVRFSQIFANDGFPIVGNCDFMEYQFGPLTQDIWRLSLGVGYRWCPNLVLKAEYTFEGGKEVGGQRRDHADFFAAEAAFKF